MIMELVAKQPSGGAGSLAFTYPLKQAGKDSLSLGAGVYDVIVTWGGKARLNVIHRFDGQAAGQRIHQLIPPADSQVQRRGMIRVGSESPAQTIVLQTWGEEDTSARATVQIIRANLELNASN